jgi:hypothetical protein
MRFSATALLVGLSALSWANAQTQAILDYYGDVSCQVAPYGGLDLDISVSCYDNLLRDPRSVKPISLGSTCVSKLPSRQPKNFYSLPTLYV